MNQSDPAEIEPAATKTLTDCRFLTLEWHDRTQTVSVACSCGAWEAATEEDDPYRSTLFKIDALVHEWALRHRAGKP